MTQTGVYVGDDPSVLASYTKWAGNTPSNVLHFLNNDSWAGFDSSVPWAAGLWKGAAVGNIWGVPLTVWGTSLEQVATGAYNDHFLKAAQALAQTHPSSDGNLYIRVGWEFNGGWMPWAAAGHEDAFVKAFQELVTTFRSVSSNFKFVWDTTNDGGNMDPAKAYPGDKYVDVIGTDVYYSPEYDSWDAKAGFQHDVARDYGLQWQQDFAAAHGKPTALSEWGIASDNAGDYIKGVTKWMADHKMVYGNYWNAETNDYDGVLSNGHNPNAGAAYKTAVSSLTDTTPAAAPAAHLTSAASPVAGDTFVFRVSGDSYQGDPHFQVLVDGHQIGGTLTTSASHAAGQTQDITLTGQFGTGAHDIAVQFLDDVYGGSATADRNLYVHQVSLNGHTLAGDAADNHAGYNSGGVANMFNNGSADFHI